jgi:hypothetical protein
VEVGWIRADVRRFAVDEEGHRRAVHRTRRDRVARELTFQLAQSNLRYAIGTNLQP